MPETVDTPTIQEIQQRIAKALEALPELDRDGRLPEELRPLARYLAPPPGETSVVMLKNGQGEEGIVSVKTAAECWNREGSTELIAHEGFRDEESQKPCQKGTREHQGEGEEPKKPRKRHTTAWGFTPIEIKGEPLSVTIIADRR